MLIKNVTIITFNAHRFSFDHRETSRAFFYEDVRAIFTRANLPRIFVCTFVCERYIETNCKSFFIPADDPNDINSFIRSTNDDVVKHDVVILSHPSRLSRFNERRSVCNAAALHHTAGFPAFVKFYLPRRGNWTCRWAYKQHRSGPRMLFLQRQIEHFTFSQILPRWGRASADEDSGSFPSVYPWRRVKVKSHTYKSSSTLSRRPALRCAPAVCNLIFRRSAVSNSALHFYVIHSFSIVCALTPNSSRLLRSRGTSGTTQTRELLTTHTYTHPLIYRAPRQQESAPFRNNRWCLSLSSR